MILKGEKEDRKGKGEQDGKESVSMFSVTENIFFHF
jgi:hypothetical protein